LCRVRQIGGDDRKVESKRARKVKPIPTGPSPSGRRSLAKKVTIDTIGPWLTLFITARSAEEIAAAIRKGTPSR